MTKNLYRSNTFRPTGPVSGSGFFGRGSELDSLSKRLSSDQSVLILGERRIGKTSLLLQAYRHLNAIGDNASRVWHEGHEGIRESTSRVAESLLKELIERTRVQPWSVRSSHDPIRALKAELKRLADNGVRTILFMNDLDDLLRSAAEEAEQIERLFRSIIDNGHGLACATSFKNLWHSGDPSAKAPLFNVFHPVTLRGFTHEEARQFLSTVSEFSGDRLENPECHLIVDLAGQIPFHLQHVGWNLFAQNGFCGSAGSERLNHITLALDEYVETMYQHIQYSLHHLSPEILRCLVGAVKNGGFEESEESRFLVQRGFLDLGERPFQTLGSLYVEVLKAIDIDEPSNQVKAGPGFFKRVSEAAIKSLVDGAIKAYFN